MREEGRGTINGIAILLQLKQSLLLLQYFLHRQMEIHLFFVKVIIIISELELFLTFQGLIFGSSLLSFEVKKVKALHFFLLKSIKPRKDHLLL